MRMACWSNTVCSKCIDVTFAIARAAAHVTHGAQCDSGGEALVEQRDGKVCAAR
jgi:hypothetical protein